MKNNLEIYKPIQLFFDELVNEFNQISKERKDLLIALSNYINHKKLANQAIKLIFICTHNSRRSHLSQILAQAAAAYYSIENVYCFSGGTEVTAFNENAVEALQNIGFQISTNQISTNPVYTVAFGINTLALQAFSKIYTSTPNPTNSFAAIMTCTQADESCPIVHGAEERFKIPYQDPKISDGTPMQEEIYKVRCKQIATEMCYVFSLLVT